MYVHSAETSAMVSLLKRTVQKTAALLAGGFATPIQPALRRQRQQIRITLAAAQHQQGDLLVRAVAGVEWNQFDARAEGAHASRQQAVADAAADQVNQGKDIADAHRRVRHEAGQLERVVEALRGDEAFVEGDEFFVAQRLQVDGRLSRIR